MPSHARTCVLCDTPEECLSGKTPCYMAGVFIEGPHKGLSTAYAAPPVLDEATAPVGAAVEGAPAADDDDREKRFDVSFRWPFPTPLMQRMNPTLFAIADEILGFFNDPEPGPDTIPPDGSSVGDLRHDAIVQAVRDLHEQLQDAVGDVTFQGDGTVSGAGQMGGMAMMMACYLAATWYSLRAKGINLTIEAKACFARALMGYSALIAADLLEQMTGEGPYASPDAAAVEPAPTSASSAAAGSVAASLAEKFRHG